MRRRRLWRTMAAMPLLPLLGCAAPPSQAAAAPRSRVRPGDPGWPSDADWGRLRQEVGGRLLKIEPPFAVCGAEPSARAAPGSSMP